MPIQPVLVRAPVIQADLESGLAPAIPNFELPDFDIGSLDLNSIQRGIAFGQHIMGELDLILGKTLQLIDLEMYI